MIDLDPVKPALERAPVLMFSDMSEYFQETVIDDLLCFCFVFLNEDNLRAEALI